MCRGEKDSPLFYLYTDNHYYEKFEDGTKNDITEEIPLDIPDYWKWIRISNCASIYTGNSISEDIKNTKYVGLKTGYNYIGTKDVGNDNNINYDNGVKIPYEEPNFRKAFKDSTLLCIEGGSAGKKIAYLTEDVCFGNKLASFNSWSINPKFLYFILQTSIFSDFFKNNITGIIGGVSINTLKKLIIPVPPINEQNRIVEKIENALNKVLKKEKNDEKIKELKLKLKEKIIDSAIKGKLVKQDYNDESAEVLIDKILNKKRELIKSKQIKKENLSIIYKDASDNQFYEKFDDGNVVNITDEIPFDIPSTWCWTRLNNISSKTIKRGKSPKYVDNSNVYVFAQKCNQKNGIITLKNAKYLDETTVKKYDESDFVREHDIVINSTGNGTLGRVGIILKENVDGKKVVVDSHVTLVRLFEKLNPIFIYYYIKNKQKYLESRATGSTNQTELSPDSIKNILIPIPPINEQLRIIEKIQKLYNYIETAE